MEETTPAPLCPSGQSPASERKLLTFAGIGARATPRGVLSLMVQHGRELCLLGHTLRSGAAPGADQAFEQGCDQAKGKKEIYLPWPGFEGSVSALQPTEKAIRSVNQYHSRPENLSPGSVKLLGRDAQIILGENLESPVDFVICWTPEGGRVGGTGYSIKIAQQNKIPVYNLHSTRDCISLMEDIYRIEKTKTKEKPNAIQTTKSRAAK